MLDLSKDAVLSEIEAMDVECATGGWNLPPIAHLTVMARDTPVTEAGRLA